MSNKPAFMRPVDVDSSNDTIYVLYEATWHDVTITNGVYSTVASVLQGFKNECTNLSIPASTFSIVTSTDGTDLRCRLTFSSNVSIIANSQLGFIVDTEYGPGTTFTGTMRPENVWVPTYQVANQERFVLDQKNLFYGDKSRVGRLVGNGLGTEAVFFRKFDFVNEPAGNVFVDACTSDCNVRRCAEWFFWQCRIVRPVVSSDPDARGFYFYQDWANVNNVPTTGDVGGVNFDYIASPDTYVFSQVDAAGFTVTGPSLPTTRERFSINIPCNTVTEAPAWDTHTILG